MNLGETISQDSIGIGDIVEAVDSAVMYNKCEKLNTILDALFSEEERPASLADRESYNKIKKMIFDLQHSRESSAGLDRELQLQALSSIRDTLIAELKSDQSMGMRASLPPVVRERYNTAIGRIKKINSEAVLVAKPEPGIAKEYERHRQAAIGPDGSFVREGRPLSSWRNWIVEVVPGISKARANGFSMAEDRSKAVVFKLPQRKTEGEVVKHNINGIDGKKLIDEGELSGCVLLRVKKGEEIRGKLYDIDAERLIDLGVVDENNKQNVIVRGEDGYDAIDDKYIIYNGTKRYLYDSEKQDLRFICDLRELKGEVGIFKEFYSQDREQESISVSFITEEQGSDGTYTLRLYSVDSTKDGRELKFRGKVEDLTKSSLTYEVRSELLQQMYGEERIRALAELGIPRFEAFDQFSPQMVDQIIETRRKFDNWESLSTAEKKEFETKRVAVIHDPVSDDGPNSGAFGASDIAKLQNEGYLVLYFQAADEQSFEQNWNSVGRIINDQSIQRDGLDYCAVQGHGDGKRLVLSELGSEKSLLDVGDLSDLVRLTPYRIKYAVTGSCHGADGSLTSSSPIEARNLHETLTHTIFANAEVAVGPDKAAGSSLYFDVNGEPACFHTDDSLVISRGANIE